MSLLMRSPLFGRSSLVDLLDTFDGLVDGRTSLFRPASDVIDSDDETVIRLDVPGVREEDIRVEVRDGVLYVSGERRHETTAKTSGFQHLERSYGKFTRHLRLPDGVDPDAISAHLDAGVLEVRVPKPERARPRTVPIALNGNGRARELSSGETEDDDH